MLPYNPRSACWRPAAPSQFLARYPSLPGEFQASFKNQNRWVVSVGWPLRLSSDLHLHVHEDACACALWGMNTCTSEHVPGTQIEPTLMILLIFWMEPVGFSLGIFFATGHGKMICYHCIFQYPAQAPRCRAFEAWCGRGTTPGFVSKIPLRDEVRRFALCPVKWGVASVVLPASLCLPWMAGNLQWQTWLIFYFCCMAMFKNPSTPDLTSEFLFLKGYSQCFQSRSFYLLSMQHSN